MNIPSILLDVIFAVTVIWIIYTAYRQGFLQSVVRTLGYLAAVIIAFFGGRMLSEACYQLFFRDRLRASLETALLESAEGNNFSEKISATIEALPKLVQNLLETAGMGPDALADRLSGSMEQSAHELSGMILETILHPLIATLLYGICFLVLFSAVMILVRCLAKAARGVRHIPLVGSVNSLLGAAMGLIQALAIWFVISAVLEFIIGMTGGTEWLNRQTISDSFLFGRFCEWTGSIFPTLNEITSWR
ncbi:MAG: CvpA family protein [Candidatus Merdivicinus sp.]|jgi:hypothetical protein